MGTNCAPLVTDLFLFCYKRNFVTSLSDDDQADIIEAFTSSSRYLDDLVNLVKDCQFGVSPVNYSNSDLIYIDNPYFECVVSLIYSTELQLNKDNASDTDAPFFIYVYQFLTGLFPPKCMIIATILIWTWYFSLFRL